MERIRVRSSNIASIGYDNNTQVLEVEFKTASVYDIANLLQLSAKEKFQLITFKTFDDKEKFLCNTYRQSICIYEKESELKDRFIFN